jgi:hypothetical protein
MVVGKEKFGLFRDAHVSDLWALSLKGDDDVVRQAQSVMASSPDLLFVHLPEVDVTGHGMGWMSASYLRAVRNADAAVGRLLASVGDRGTGDRARTIAVDPRSHRGHGGNGGAASWRDAVARRQRAGRRRGTRRP